MRSVSSWCESRPAPNSPPSTPRSGSATPTAGGGSRSTRPARTPRPGLDESSPSAVRVGPDRAGEGPEGAWADRAVLGVTTERVAVAHVAVLPDAQAAHPGLGEVREEMPGALRREHAPGARVEVAVRVELARAGVRHELD